VRSAQERTMKSGAKHLSSPGHNAWPLAMWIRVLSLILMFALSSSVAVGSPLHSSERGCNVPSQISECEHMNPTAPTVQMVQLCCLLDCQEPGSTGSPQIQIPSWNSPAVHQLAAQPSFRVTKSLPQTGSLHGLAFKPPDTYLQNLALLI
jgi:hypothetical protein